MSKTMSLAIPCRIARYIPKLNPSLQRFSTTRPSMAQLTVTPNIALVDDKVHISVSGLRRHQKVTLHAVLKDRKTFTSGGHFVADDNGCVIVSKHESSGGTYTGVDTMGLFWSLQPIKGEPRYTRITKRDVETPFIVKLYAVDGHADVTGVEPGSTVLADTSLERWYKHPSVTRLPVKQGKLRATLFLPEGSDRFPGIIDMFGSTGGLVETRAALLASRGFVVLALAYFNYDDLTTELGNLDFNYFMDAAAWLANHPRVLPGGIGTFGVSKGAELGMILAAYSDNVKAVVSVNGATAYTLCDLKYGDELFIKGVPFDISQAVMEEAGLNLKDCNSDWEHSILPIKKTKAPILWLLGEDDQNWDNQRTKILYKSLPAEVKKMVKLKYYPGAGHLIEPPYMPLCKASFHKMGGANLVWGGDTRKHAAAQEDAWTRALAFLRENLTQTTVKHKL